MRLKLSKESMHKLCSEYVLDMPTMEETLFAQTTHSHSAWLEWKDGFDRYELHLSNAFNRPVILFRVNYETAKSFRPSIEHLRELGMIEDE